MTKRRRLQKAAAFAVAIILMIPALPAYAAEPTVIENQTISEDTEYEGDVIIKNSTFERKLTVKGNAVIESGTFKDDVEITGDVEVKDGSFACGLSVQGKVGIAGGTFNSDTAADSVGAGGEIEISGGTFNCPVATSSGVRISGGTFKEDVVAKGESVIKGGTFEALLYFASDSAILALDFAKAVFASKNLEIAGGNIDLAMVTGDVSVSAGEIGGLLTRGNVSISGGKIGYLGAIADKEKKDLNKVIISGGDFKGNKDTNSVLDISGCEVLISGGTFTTAADIHQVALIREDGDLMSAVTITGGTFTGNKSTKSDGVMLKNCKSVNISGGAFTGYGGALALYNESKYGKADVSITGGRYGCLGNEVDEDVYGAIAVMVPKEEWESSHDVSVLNALLGKDAAYCPALEYKSLPTLKGFESGIVYTQREIAVASVVTPDGSELKEAGLDIVNSIISTGKAEGVSEELAAKIREAALDGKPINIGLAVNEVKEEDVKEDLGKVNYLLSDKDKVLALYSIEIRVSIDGKVAGNITNVGKEVPFRVKIPEGIGAGDGEFFFVRVHDGAETKLQATVNGEYVEAASSLYSTFALVYRPTVKSPQTGDTTPIWMLGIIAGLTGTVIIIDKKLYRYR